MHSFFPHFALLFQMKRNRYIALWVGMDPAIIMTTDHESADEIQQQTTFHKGLNYITSSWGTEKKYILFDNKVKDIFLSTNSDYKS